MFDYLRRCCNFKGKWICLGLFLVVPFFGLPKKSEAQDFVRLPARILEIKDPILISSVWQAVFPDSIAPKGDYHLLIPTASEQVPGKENSAKVYLLRNGTEVGSFEKAEWNNISGITNSAMEVKEVQEGRDFKETPVVWRSLDFSPDTLLRWAQWPAGVSFGIGTGVSSIQSSKPQFRQDIDFAWDQKLFDNFLLGVELHKTHYGGGLTRFGKSLEDPDKGNDFFRREPEFWSDAYWWWGLSAGMPGVKYTVSLANQPLPHYFWLETRASSAVRKREPGQLVKQWQGSTLALKGNLAHTLDARLGVLRYQFHVDKDAYRVPVQTMALRDLPGMFGTWGLGLVFASDLVATRLWVDIPTLEFGFNHPNSFPSRFRISLLHVDVAYRNLRSFNLGVSIRVKVANPLLNRPGV